MILQIVDSLTITVNITSDLLRVHNLYATQKRYRQVQNTISSIVMAGFTIFLKTKQLQLISINTADLVWCKHQLKTVWLLQCRLSYQLEPQSHYSECAARNSLHFPIATRTSVLEYYKQISKSTLIGWFFGFPRWYHAYYGQADETSSRSTYYQKCLISKRPLLLSLDKFLLNGICGWNIEGC